MFKLNQQGVVAPLLMFLLVIGLIAGVYLVTSDNPLKFFSKAGNPPIVFKDIKDNVLPQQNGIPQSTSTTVKIELTSTLGPPAGKNNTAGSATTSGVVKAVTSGISCNQVSLNASPNPVATSRIVNFSISGDASTFVGDSFGGGAANCKGSWNNLSCTAANQPGTYTWTHTWKHCVGDFNHCSDTCSASLSYRVSSSLSTPTPTFEPFSTSAPTPSPAEKRSTVSYRVAENPADLSNAPYQSYTKEPTIITYTFKGSNNDSNQGQKFFWVEFKDSTGKTDRRSAQIQIVVACKPRPACLDLKRFACKMPEPVSGWCPNPTSTPSPTPSPSPSPAFSAGTNVTGITHYGYRDTNPYCSASAGYAVGGAPLPSPIPGGRGANLYVNPNNANLSDMVVVTSTADLNCSANTDFLFATGLGNCRGGCGDGGVTDGCTCSGGNPKDGKACWWRWTCTATAPGSFTATFNTVFSKVASSNVDADLLEMQRMGMKIIRVFPANKYIDDNESARRLGLFLDKANSYGISVIISLIDFYNSGFSPQGLEQYYTGSYNGIGLLGHEFFTTGYQTRYKDFVRSVVAANKNKSNIYAWEPGNELTDRSFPQTFLSFMRDITGTIKSIDSQHVVATGVLNSAHTGLSPQDLYSQLPNVDIVTVHTYDGDRSGSSDIDWAKNHQKNAVVEEFGFGGSGNRSENIRNESNYWKDRGASAVLQWGFIAKGLPDNGNGDNRYGMDTIWHTDYDALALLYQSFNNIPAR